MLDALHVDFLSSEGWLFCENHVKQPRQFDLLLIFTSVVGSVLSEPCEFVGQDALGYGLRQVDRVSRRVQLPTLVLAAYQRPSFSFQSLVQHVRLTALEGNQLIDLNLDPALVSCYMHLLYSEMVEYHHGLSRLEEVMPAEHLLRIIACLQEGCAQLFGIGPSGVKNQHLKGL